MSHANVIALNRLRVVGLLEGASFLLLLGVAMPLKYLAGMPEMVRIVGWTHGLLFVSFLAVVAQVARRMAWPYDRVAGAVAAALLPFGTFVLDRRLRGAIRDARQSARSSHGE
jgi:integral membrane protein